MKYEIVGIEHAVGDFIPTTGKNANTVQHFDVYLEYHYVLSPPWVRVCLDLAVRPTGKVKYLLCCVFNCKGAGTELIRKFSILQSLSVG